MLDKELQARLHQFGVPFVEGEFIDTYQTPVPEPPYICYLCIENTIGPDECPDMLKHIQIVIEIYIEQQGDHELIDRFEKEVLFDVEYQKEEVYIHEENLIQVNYDIQEFIKNY